jgi:1,4-alpha-glucan branching enzyme
MRVLCAWVGKQTVHTTERHRKNLRAKEINSSSPLMVFARMESSTPHPTPLTEREHPLSASASKPAGYLSLTLHAHLPWVINHGTWPHGMEWLLEAAAESYLPLLRVLRNLERDGIALCCNLNLTPILLEQLTHPLFKAEFPQYLERKIAAAREDESYFLMMSEHHYAHLARFWQRSFTEALEDFRALDNDIVAGFRGFHQRGLIEIISSGATHGYMPLLGTDESLRAQVRVAVATHERHIGEAPRGIWAPECGYRPAGPWSFPVTNSDGTTIAAPANRIGIEQALDESGLHFFFVDSHLIERGSLVNSPYASHISASQTHVPHTSDARRLYHPYLLKSTHTSVAVFPRDPRSGIQVWSGDTGYPGDEHYLDFHKKRWPGGHRYWRVTGHNIDMGDKQPYYPEAAAERIREHAAHFVHLVEEALQPSMGGDVPPILSSPFDAELFGHWWFEGPAWLEAVARLLHNNPNGLALISASSYLKRFPPTDTISLSEGSWGAGGGNDVWLNAETSWTWQHLYPAELFIRDTVTNSDWRTNPTHTRILQQLCRELLLMESSDWPFLITTGAARDYAEMRFNTHHEQFNELRNMLASDQLTDDQQNRLTEIETRDNIFPNLDPTFWTEGAKASKPTTQN